jgi:hypothetical protein
VLAVAAALDHAPVAAGALTSFDAVLVACMLRESALVSGSVGDAVEHSHDTASALRAHG